MRNTSDVDFNQQMLIESVGGDSLSKVCLADIPLSEACQDGSVGDV
jgi:hypothetical protein